MHVCVFCATGIFEHRVCRTFRNFFPELVELLDRFESNRIESKRALMPLGRFEEARAVLAGEDIPPAPRLPPGVRGQDGQDGQDDDDDNEDDEDEEFSEANNGEGS